MKVTNKPARTELVEVEPAKVVVEFTPKQARLVGMLLGNVICADLRESGFNPNTCLSALGYITDEDSALVNMRRVAEVRDPSARWFEATAPLPVAFRVDQSKL